MTRFFLYTCRHGDNVILTPASKRAWDYLIEQMAICNNMTIEEIVAEGEFEVGGSFEEGHLYIDDGGSIYEIYLTEVP